MINISSVKFYKKVEFFHKMFYLKIKAIIPIVILILEVYRKKLHTEIEDKIIKI